MNEATLVSIVFIFAFGAAIGSFLNVVIYRLPRGKSIVFPGSHCPNCGQPIQWYDNLPLLSWCLLRGQCRSCKVKISPRYLIIEAATALMLVGLFVWYFIYPMRDGIDSFASDWPTFLAHGILLCGLLVCTATDLDSWIVPLEVCWVVSIVGAAAATIHPPQPELLPMVSPTLGAMCVAAGVGLIVSAILQHVGVLQPSFIDAADTVRCETNSAGDKSERIISVAATKDHGVNPRTEILREVLYLAPAVGLAIAVWVVFSFCPGFERWVDRLSSVAHHAKAAPHWVGFQAALAGYLIGGLWIWGTRIFGTLAFGKEAMGLGDVHLLAAVGAVTGWVTPSLAFFIAPFFGLLWALNVAISRRQREIPYGPWLAAAAVVVMLTSDGLVRYIRALN
jgi:leader peptidase (prepilin peptidase) / N-methyltransferase